MATMSGIPYVEVQFTKEGAPRDPAEVAAARALVADLGVTDLIVISHGWNNDMAEARRLYRRFFAAFVRGRRAATADPLAGATPAVLGVLWPAKKFADDELTAGGAASADEGVTLTEVRRRISQLARLLDDPAAAPHIRRARALLPELADSPAAQRAFVEALKELMPEPSAPDEDAAAMLDDLPGDVLLSQLGDADTPNARRTDDGIGGAAAFPDQGDAAGLGDLVSRVRAGARNLANVTTYYVMKERAATVGTTGLAPLLDALRAAPPPMPAPRLHLVGHSFGARLVTATVAAMAGGPADRVQTLSLLQAAFSHYGFAEDWRGTEDGFFRKVVTEGRVAGPTVITYTRNDKAVGTAYAIASRIARQAGEAIGDADDTYGGLGRNGARKTPEAMDGDLLAAAGGDYAFEAGRLYNLNGDAYIQGHSDVGRDEVARAVLAAMVV